MILHTWLALLFPSLKQKPEIVVEDTSTALTVVEGEVAKQVEPELTEFQKLRAKFNKNTDLIVISEHFVEDLDDDDLAWLNDLGNKAIYFPNNMLVNTSIVRAGYGWQGM